MNNKIKSYSLIALLGLSALSLYSCLDHDTPGDEFQSTQRRTTDVIFFGKADSIDYKATITEEQYNRVEAALQTPLQTALGGQYGICGGKNGDFPKSHSYQYQYSLGTDGYSQYQIVPHYDFPYSNNAVQRSTYAITQQFYGGAVQGFGESKPYIVPLLNNPVTDSIPEIKALYLLLYDYVSLDYADMVGPFPYSDYKGNKQTSPFTYETVESIYKHIVANIDTVVACLNYFPQKPTWYQDKVKQLIYANFRLTSDEMYGNNPIETYRQFANSIKLRMAMHIVKVEPELAQQWAEEAVASGVIEDYKHEVSLRSSLLGFTHPLVEIASWGDIRLSASFESLLKSLNHPYVENLFTKNSAEFTLKDGTVSLAANADVVGIRAGSHVGTGQNGTSNPYIRFSRFNAASIFNAPIFLMKLSEVCFLRAEGAVRGWAMGGSAQDFYYKGIDYASLEDRDYLEYEASSGQKTNYYSLALDAYKALETPRAFTYKDPTGETPDMESVTTIGVKWNESDDREVKLEKIITQKYISLYPNSHEAWTEMRRTGYPKVFPVLHPDDGDGSLRPGELVRRIPFVGTNDVNVAKDVETTGMRALGGDDLQATRLWWDVNRSNF